MTLAYLSRKNKLHLLTFFLRILVLYFQFFNSNIFCITIMASYSYYSYTNYDIILYKSALARFRADVIYIF